MTVPECTSYRLALGALVLGALAPSEREQVERHVAACERCRAELAELASLPGMLNLVRPDDIPTSDEDDLQPTPRLLESLLTAAADEPSPTPSTPALDVARHTSTHGRHRGTTRPPRRRDPSGPSRRSTWLLGVGAAAAAVVVAVIVWVVVGTGSPNDPDRADVTASATDPTTLVSATVALAPAGDGTDVEVTISGVPSGAECDLVVVSTDGDDDIAASWTASYAGSASVTGHVRFDTDDIERLDVTTDDGVIVTVPLR